MVATGECACARRRVDRTSKVAHGSGNTQAAAGREFASCAGAEELPELPGPTSLHQRTDVSILPSVQHDHPINRFPLYCSFKLNLIQQPPTTRHAQNLPKSANLRTVLYQQVTVLISVVLVIINVKLTPAFPFFVSDIRL